MRPARTTTGEGLGLEDARASARSIAVCQRPDGMIPWFEGGHADPWNHVEAAMALDVAGLAEEAWAAYQWLVRRQLPEGGWFNYYAADGSVEDPRIDTNTCAYLATGAWHRYLLHGELAELGALWPAVDRAVELVLRCQRPDGTIRWSIDPDGRPGRYALLTGSSSVLSSLRCAVACAEALGEERPAWELAAGRLAHAIAHRPGAFEPKDEFAMDWYYPVLSGALEAPRAQARLAGGWRRFVIEGRGVRCVANQPWVTAAETAECAIALAALGQRARAESLLSWTASHRQADGSYLTGLVVPHGVSFPRDEATTYSAAAVVLAGDALARWTPAAGLLLGESLPEVVDLEAVGGVDGEDGAEPETDRGGAQRRSRARSEPQVPSSLQSPEATASHHSS
ncbi:prenyltransferase/squalene oxidase repeat-containing protein [Aciditerrimonas ferrireducens]|uniref:Prenyltransferase/squalene oxidase repeat-containing protein n=1 Tax=Aciditerrimonas ferrireducens TaxID=667306 RepID=A0ABV6C3Y5_9ACTN